MKKNGDHMNLIITKSGCLSCEEVREFFEKSKVKFREVNCSNDELSVEVGGQAVLGRQNISPTPWLTERHGYDPTSFFLYLLQIIHRYYNLPL